MNSATEMFKRSEVPDNNMGDKSEQYFRVSGMILCLSLYVQLHPGEEHTQLQLNNIIQKNPYINPKSSNSLTKLYDRIIGKEDGEVQAELMVNNPNSIMADLETVMNAYDSKKISVDDASSQRIELEERFTGAILNYYFLKVNTLQQQYLAGKVGATEIVEKRDELNNEIRSLEDRFCTIRDDLEIRCDEEREFSRK